MLSVTEQMLALFKGGYDKGSEAVQEGIKHKNVLEQLRLSKDMDLSNKKEALANSVKTAANMAGVDVSQPGWEQQVLPTLAKKGQSASFGEDKFSVGADPTIKAMGAQREEANRQRLIKNIQDTYNKVVGKSPDAVRAARNVLAAIDAGDVSTVGRMKAQLPQLEGENYRPTDAERKAMLSHTGEGAIADLKNFFGGDDAALSKAQIDAFRKLAQKRINDEDTQVQRGRHEAISRWAKAKALSPEDMDAVGGTLGMSQEDLIKELQGASKPAAGGTIRVKHKKTGQTGTLPANEFDPAQYEKIQ